MSGNHWDELEDRGFAWDRNMGWPRARVYRGIGNTNRSAERVNTLLMFYTVAFVCTGSN